MSKSDGDLVALAQAGNLDAFDQLVLKHQARVYALAYRILGNGDDAADVQQETFVRAWRSLGKFRRDAELTTWLHRITVNLCLTIKRKRDYSYTEPLVEDRMRYSGEAVGTACMEATETAIALRKVVGAMPAHYRALLVLREIEGRCFEEIARILGCSPQSARSRACKARKLLRDRMRPYLEGE
ncbi:MAG: sigma-70 family RNA polymerase sigma factor [Armatimonadetes bacterium]|nr:sigma-70 family RNA polymerase sigma factor [Armatimonadota bacterium]